MSDGPDDLSTRIEALARELQDIARLSAVLEPHERAQAQVMKLLFRHLRSGRGRIDVGIWNAAIDEAVAGQEGLALAARGETADRHHAHADALRAFKVTPRIR